MTNTTNSLSLEAASLRLGAAALALMPFVTWAGCQDATLLPRWFFCAVVFSLSTCLLLISNEDAKINVSRIGLLGLAGLATLAVISISYAAVLPEAVKTSLNQLTMVVVFLCLSLLSKQKDGLYYLSFGVVLATIIIEIVGIGQLLNVQEVGSSRNDLYTVTGWMGHRNLYAAALLISIPFHLNLLSKSKAIVRVILVSNIVMVCTIIVFLGCRSVWLALTGGMLFFAAIIAFGTVKSNRKYVIGFFVAALLSLAVVVCLVRIFAGDLLGVGARIDSLMNIGQANNVHTSTISERLALWHSTLLLIKDHFWAGVGAGQWQFLFGQYGLAGTRAEQGLVTFQRPHNDFLWYFAEQGIVGVLLYSGLLGAAIYKGAAAYLKTKDVTFAFAAMGVVFYSIFSFFDFPRERTYHSILLVLLLAISLRTDSGFRVNTGKPFITVFAVLAAVIIFGYYRIIGQDTQFRRGLIQRAIGDKEAMHYAMDKAKSKWFFTTDATSTSPDFYIGEAFSRAGNHKEAIVRYEAALRYTPNHVATLNNAAAEYYYTGDSATAEKYWKKILAIAPASLDANLNMAAKAYGKGDTKSAFAYLYAAENGRVNARYINFVQVIGTDYLNKYLNDTTGKRKIAAMGIVSDIDWFLSVREHAKISNQSFTDQVNEEILFLMSKK